MADAAEPELIAALNELLEGERARARARLTDAERHAAWSNGDTR